jgi:uncharacterized protein YjbI with pentapeptide repeats
MSDEEKPRLKPANENPWYCLATVYGEQKESVGRPLAIFDKSLDNRNRAAWNRWVAPALPDEQRAELIKKGFDASELIPLSQNEQTEFLKVYAERTNAALPDPKKEGISFRDVLFEQPISFRGFVFPMAPFTRAEFHSKADFSKAAFFGLAIFDDSTFSSVAYFTEAYFRPGAFFNRVKFSGFADFNKTAFFESALFFEATFSSTAYFRETAFSSDVFFKGAKFSGETTFGAAEFSGDADFGSCEFKSQTRFSRAKFTSRVPVFYDTKLREGTDWGLSTWPPPPKDHKDAQAQVFAYGRLKAEMDRLNRPLDAQIFFAKELRAHRELEKRYSPQRALNFLYQIFSFYGASAELPMLWLLVLFLLGFGFFALIPVYKGAPLSYDEAAGLSFTNLISFLPYKPNKDIIEGLSPFAKIIGDLQSFLGVLLLFLLGLALRNRFRMK